MNHLKEHILKTYWNQYHYDINSIINYGTAGFRNTYGDLLKGIIFRMGILASLRSIVLNKSIGIMITASHNHYMDNGIKMIDYNGEILDSKWEEYANILVNIKTYDEFIGKINKMIPKKSNSQPEVLIGMDNRQHSYELSSIACIGALCLSSIIININELTTPIIHYLVFIKNYKNKICHPDNFINNSCKIFKKMMKPNSKYSDIWVDCANGVGGLSMSKYSRLLSDYIKINIINYNEGPVNLKCGADYVQKNNILPNILSNIKDLNNKIFVSLDGDADRFIYYYINKDNKLHILDGDNILLLFSKYIKDLINHYNLNENIHIIITNYTNDKIKEYLEQNNFIIHKTKTGVKNLHKEAKKYPISIYFETNGHGTILIDETKIKNKDILNNLNYLLNPYVGDAIHNCILINIILNYYNMTMDDWYNMVIKRQSKQLTLKVNNKNLFICNDDESKLIEPKNIQNNIDVINNKYNCRSFIRPSGTEDILRIYIEADNNLNIIENEILNLFP